MYTRDTASSRRTKEIARNAAFARLLSCTYPVQQTARV